MNWGKSYDPFQHAESLGVEIIQSHAVRGFGDYRGGIIRLHPDLTQTEARCTTAHEIVHHQHRDDILGYCGVAWLDNRLERAVHTVASRRLVTVPDLVDALRWSEQPVEIADHLVVDLRTLYTRARGLTRGEYVDLVERSRGRVRQSFAHIRAHAEQRIPRPRDL